MDDGLLRRGPTRWVPLWTRIRTPREGGLVAILTVLLPGPSSVAVDTSLASYNDWEVDEMLENHSGGREGGGVAVTVSVSGCGCEVRTCRAPRPGPGAGGVGVACCARWSRRLDHSCRRATAYR